MERRRTEWAVVVATFAATGLVLGVASNPIRNVVRSQAASFQSSTLDSFTQVTFPDSVRAFEFYGKQRIVAALENGNLECRNLNGNLLWRVNDVNATDLVFTRDGKRVLAWGADNGVHVFVSEGGIEETVLQTSAPVAWSANERYFVAKSNGNPVVADVVTGKLRPCGGADEDTTAVSNTGTVYHLQGSKLTLSSANQTIQWNDNHFISSKAQPDWSFITQSHFGPSYAIDINADFSDVSTVRVSPNGDTLALGRNNGIIELVSLPSLIENTEPTRQAAYVPPSKIEVTTVSLPKSLTWMEWLQEGVLTASYGDTEQDDFCLIGEDGAVLASQQDLKLPWITAKGTMTLETRNGTVTARRFLNAESSTEWVLDIPTVDTDTPTRVYGENLAAISSGQTISFYEVPKP